MSPVNTRRPVDSVKTQVWARGRYEEQEGSAVVEATQQGVSHPPQRTETYIIICCTRVITALTKPITHPLDAQLKQKPTRYICSPGRVLPLTSCNGVGYRPCEPTIKWNLYNTQGCHRSRICNTALAGQRLDFVSHQSLWNKRVPFGRRGKATTYTRRKLCWAPAAANGSQLVNEP